MSTPPKPQPAITPSARRAPQPPGPGPVASARLLSGFLDRPIETLATLKSYGDVALLKSSGYRIVGVFHPDLIAQIMVSDSSKFVKGRTWRVIKPLLGEGLFISEGELHRRQRRLVAPAFQPRNLSPYAAMMAGHASERMGRWADGQRLDMHHEMIELSLRIAGLTMFGASFEDEEATRFGKASDEAIGYYRYAVLPGSSLLLHLPIPPVRRFKRARALIDETVYGIIADRHASAGDGVHHGDLLSLMLAARDTEGDGTGMSDQQVRDESVTALIAGHETVASSLSWTLYLLARNPDVLARVREEVADGVGDGEATWEAMQQFDYLRRVCMESLRLYPPGYVTVREAAEDVEVGGFLIRKGSEVSLPIWHVHRDERWWPDPDRFDPDRFLPGADEGRPKHAYIPFGSGRRVCIGQGFAMLEMLVVLATILPRWTPEMAVDREVEVETNFSQRPKGGLPMVVRAAG